MRGDNNGGIFTEGGQLGGGGGDTRAYIFMFLLELSSIYLSWIFNFVSLSLIVLN
jgi:hypothetical protein